MPRGNRRSAGKEVVIPSNSLVASSTRYPGKAARIYQPRQDWQAECYRHYAICGEARYAANFFGNALSRATLGIAHMVGETPVKDTVGPAWDLLQELFAGKDGQKQMLNAIGIHFTIAGECYLVGRQVDGGDVWEIVSVMEMQVTGDAWQINYGDGLPPVILTDKDVVIRMWVPNPAKRIEADSPFRSLLPILGEIEWLTRHVFSQITSRLASAGILFISQDMTFPPPPVAGGQQVPDNQASAFMMTLGDAMLTPIEDPSSPAAVVPIVASVPGDQVENAARLLTFWSELDSEAKLLRQEAIQRFAIGMDLPPEEILGMSSNLGTGGGASNGVSHWGAWQIEESTIKMHVEPKLDTVVNAITMGYIRPGLDDWEPFVTYDTASLRLRPDRSKEAFELWDRGLLSDQRLLEENGFSIDDSPEAAEFHKWLLRKVAGGTSTPEQMTEALRQLGVTLGQLESNEQGREERPPPSLEEHPTRPRTPADAASLLLAASEPLVFRALERAGNRLRSSGSRPPGVPAYETHCYVTANGSASKVMEDAWSCAAMTLDAVSAEPDKVVEVLDAYCLSLINEQVPHSRARLQQWLDLGGVG